MTVLRLPIQTPRLVLRDFVAADAAAVLRYTADPRVVEHMFYAPWTIADAQAHLASLERSQQAVPRRLWELAVVERSSGEVIGSVDLTPLDDDGADLGYSLQFDAWGKGYASEAASALLDAGFARLALPRIVAVCAVENTASARVLEKTGLRFVETVHAYREAKGRSFSVHRYELTQAQWQRARVDQRDDA